MRAGHWACARNRCAPLPLLFAFLLLFVVVVSPTPAAAQSVSDVSYDLYLFVAGASPASVQARRNLEQLCAQHLPGRYTLAVVDIQQHPERAVQENLLGIPCLIKKSPGLVRRLVGDLADRGRVLKLLGLEAG